MEELKDIGKLFDKVDTKDVKAVFGCACIIAFGMSVVDGIVQIVTKKSAE